MKQIIKHNNRKGNDCSSFQKIFADQCRVEKINEKNADQKNNGEERRIDSEA